MKTSLLIILILLTVGIVLTGGCGETDEQVDNDPELSGELPDQESRPFEIVMSTKGVTSARVVSGYMAFYSSKDIYYLSDSVTADFYDEIGEHSSRLTSMRATINEKEDLLFAQDNVVVVSDSGATLLTDSLYWNNSEEKIYTDDFVTIFTENDTLHGKGFTSDRSLKNYEIKNPTGVSHRISGDKK